MQPLLLNRPILVAADPDGPAHPAWDWANKVYPNWVCVEQAETRRRVIKHKVPECEHQHSYTLLTVTLRGFAKLYLPYWNDEDGRTYSAGFQVEPVGSYEGIALSSPQAVTPNRYEIDDVRRISFWDSRLIHVCRGLFAYIATQNPDLLGGDSGHLRQFCSMWEAIRGVPTVDTLNGIDLRRLDTLPD